MPPHAPTPVWIESIRTCNTTIGTCNRYFLRTENLSTVNQFLLLLRTRYLLPLATVSQKPRSRSKFGMTVLGGCEYVTSRHLNLIHHLSLSFRRTENCSTDNEFSCSYEPATCYHLPRFLKSPDPGSSPGSQCQMILRFLYGGERLLFRPRREPTTWHYAFHDKLYRMKVFGAS